MKAFLGHCVLSLITGLACGASVGVVCIALYTPSPALADPTAKLPAEQRSNTVPFAWDDPFSGEFTPTATATNGPSLGLGSRAAYFQITAPSTNTGVMLIGGADDTTPDHQLPAGSTMLACVAQLSELSFKGADADDKITYLAYR